MADASLKHRSDSKAYALNRYVLFFLLHNKNKSKVANEKVLTMWKWFTMIIIYPAARENQNMEDRRLGHRQ